MVEVLLRQLIGVLRKQKKILFHEVVVMKDGSTWNVTIVELKPVVDTDD